MEKRKISAKDLVADIRRGVTYGHIKVDYMLSEEALDTLFEEIVQAGLVQKEELPIKAILLKRSKKSQISTGNQQGYTRPLPPNHNKLPTLRWITVMVSVIGGLFLVMWLHSLLSPTSQDIAQVTSKTASSDHEACRELNADWCRNVKEQRRQNIEARTREESGYDAAEGYLGDEMLEILDKMERLDCNDSYPQLRQTHKSCLGQ